MMQERWGFLESQIEAILAMPLYRLIQSDLIVWQNEAKQLKQAIKEYEQLINDPVARKQAYKAILQQYEKTFANCRRKTKVKWLEQEKQSEQKPATKTKTPFKEQQATNGHLTITKGGLLFYHSEPTAKLSLAKGDQTLFT